MRTSLDALCKSGSETTGVASSNGLEIVTGFVDFRTDGTIKNGFAVSSNGGQTWSHLVVRPPTQYQDSLEADPMTAYDARTNTLFAGGISRAKCIYVAKKVPGQDAFGPSVVARISSWPDKGWMAVGPRYREPMSSRLYVAYNEGIIWSDDLGSTWTPPLSLGTGFGFLPRVGPEGELYLTYWDGYWGIKFTRSYDGGQTWSTPIQPATRMASWGVENYGIPGTFRNFTNNAMAVNPANGDIVIVYVDQTNIVSGQKNLDLYVVRSSDQGTTWTVAERLPFRPLWQISDMIFPWVEFTREGRLHLFAMDTSRNQGQIDGVEHGLWDQFYSYSDDSCRTWSDGWLLASSSWDSSFHGTGTARFLGDYQGMAVSARAVWPVYPDTRTGQAEVYVNKIWSPIEIPASGFWNVGKPLGGSLSALYLRDGNAMRAGPVPMGNLEVGVQLETSVPVDLGNPTSMTVCLWAGANSENLRQRTELFNAVTGLWETIDERSAPLEVSALNVVVGHPTDYVSEGVARVRTTFKSIRKRPIMPWTATIDQAVVLVQP